MNSVLEKKREEIRAMLAHMREQGAPTAETGMPGLAVPGKKPAPKKKPAPGMEKLALSDKLDAEEEDELEDA